MYQFGKTNSSNQHRENILQIIGPHVKTSTFFAKGLQFYFALFQASFSATAEINGSETAQHFYNFGGNEYPTNRLAAGASAQEDHVFKEPNAVQPRDPGIGSYSRSAATPQHHHSPDAKRLVEQK